MDDFLDNYVGVGSAWISDKSRLSDFGPELAASACEKLKAVFGMEVKPDALILDLLREIYAMQGLVQRTKVVTQ